MVTEIIPSCGNNPEIIRKIRTNGSAHHRQGANCNNRFVTYLPDTRLCEDEADYNVSLHPITAFLFHSLLRLTLMLLKRGVSFPMGELFSPISYGLPVRKVFPLARSPLIPAIPQFPFLLACSQDTGVAKLKLYKLRHKLLLFCVKRDKFSQPWEIKPERGRPRLTSKPPKCIAFAQRILQDLLHVCLHICGA